MDILSYDDAVNKILRMIYTSDTKPTVIICSETTRRLMLDNHSAITTSDTAEIPEYGDPMMFDGIEVLSSKDVDDEEIRVY